MTRMRPPLSCAEARLKRRLRPGGGGGLWVKAECLWGAEVKPKHEAVGGLKCARVLLIILLISTRGKASGSRLAAGGSGG